MDETIFFPYKIIRPVQDELIISILDALKNHKNLIAHAPTGLGKTVSALGPCLKHAIGKDLKIFFLTSRHTQHALAMQTLSDIKKEFKLDFSFIDIIGRKWLCLQPNAEKFFASEFAEFCKSLKEDDVCDFYRNFKKKEKLSKIATDLIKELKKEEMVNSELIIKRCEEKKICPYEVALQLAKDAKVIVTDYYYIFHDKIRETILARTNNELQNLIIVVDEAHNLPSRVKDLATARLSDYMIKNALKEAKKYGYQEMIFVLKDLFDILKKYSEKISGDGEAYIEKEDFVEKVKKIMAYEQLVLDLKAAGEDVREEQRQSYLASLALFLEAWQGGDEGFTRILSIKTGKKGTNIILSYRCLDPSLVTKPVMEQAYSTILMSGTLNPTSMYKELLGVPEAVEKTFSNPFPKHNKLSIIIPKTSTKYTMRSEYQYNEIAKIVSELIDLIPGNSAVFFPSYRMKDDITQHIICKKTLFPEQPRMTKEQKLDFLERFKKYKDHGACLLGVITGSFGEGIDLPGDYLNSVIVVGLPLTKPDLETQALIKYYDKKFGKGWDYGYVFPAFIKTMQSAGRCIRSETDRGVIVFLDERYAWPTYKRCFPADADIVVGVDYKRMITEFFNK